MSGRRVRHVPERWPRWLLLTAYAWLASQALGWLFVLHLAGVIGP